MPDLQNFAPTPKNRGNMMTYLFIAAFVLVNAIYFGMKRHAHPTPGYTFVNGGQILAFHPGDSVKQTCFIVYSYPLKGKVVVDSMAASNDYLAFAPSLTGKFFPVVFDESNQHILMFAPKQYKSMSMHFPDSLKWLDQELQADTVLKK